MNIGIGSFELCGISFRKDMSIDEVLGNPNFQSYANSNSPVNIFTSEQANVDGYTFNVKIFFMNKRLDRIQLVPVNLEMKDPGYPDEKYQAEKKKVAESFLRSKLGEPVKESEAVLCYEFPWGKVSSISFLSGRNEYTGGFIEISYRK